MTDYAEKQASAAVQLAVVGHTNTGKTSLIRTLLRSPHFGVVEDSAGTTRHVERAALLVDGEAIIELFDTPGLEDTAGLLDAMQADGGQDDVRDFLNSTVAEKELAQEAKVMRQGLQSDALFYVVDVRAPRLEKYDDELRILSTLGKPIIPVFNFIVDHAQELQEWRALMIAHNLHAALEFDTVAFSFESEKRLYQKLQSVLEAHYEPIQRLIDHRETEWRSLLEAAARCSLALVTQCACYRLVLSEQDDAEQAKQVLQQSLRQFEQNSLNDMIRLFSFSKTDIQLAQLPVTNGEWDLDLFSTDTLKMF